MASENKASEGMALLSMYGDEDDAMDALDEEVENIRVEGVSPLASDAVAVNDNDGMSDHGNEYMQRQQEERGLDDDFTPNKAASHATPPASATPQQPQFFGSDLNSVQSQNSRLTIVDYGHEEGAMSPEAEEGEIMATDRVMYGAQLLTSDGESRENQSPGVAQLPTPSTRGTTPQSLEPADQLKSDAVNYAANESEVAGTEDAVMASVDEHQKVDPLDDFLPPPPKAKCSVELQEKITRFLALKKTSGRSFNAEVRNRKEYRNPDFLLHAVTYQDIDQIGSCFRKDVFDPHGYDKSDFCDEIEVDMRRDIERKELERKKNQKLEFTPGAIQPGNVLPTSKINIPTPGSTAVSTGVLNLPPASSDAIARDGRQNKKSKWDKVDVDQRSSLDSGGQGNVSAVGAHATLLSASKAGSGYSAFAQQRRKEAEDRRSSDRKSDRR